MLQRKSHRHVSAGLVAALLVGWGGPSLAGTIAGTVNTKIKRFSKDVVVHIVQAPGQFAPPKEHLAMDQKNMVFIPHVLPVVVGATVDFLNSDSVAHNVFSPDGEKYNLGTWPKGEMRSHTFKNLGEYAQLCNVHPEMLAYVLVLQNPFLAVTGKDGAYKIENVPAGTYALRAWSEKYKAVEQQVVVPADGTVQVDFPLAEKR